MLLNEHLYKCFKTSGLSGQAAIKGLFFFTSTQTMDKSKDQFLKDLIRYASDAEAS